MRGAEGVVHVDSGESGQTLREFRIVGFFARVEAQVLEQQDLSRLQALRRRLRFPSDALLDEPDRTPESFRERDRHGRQ